MAEKNGEFAFGVSFAIGPIKHLEPVNKHLEPTNKHLEPLEPVNKHLEPLEPVNKHLEPLEPVNKDKCFSKKGKKRCKKRCKDGMSCIFMVLAFIYITIGILLITSDWNIFENKCNILDDKCNIFENKCNILDDKCNIFEKCNILDDNCNIQLNKNVDTNCSDTLLHSFIPISILFLIGFIKYILRCLCEMYINILNFISFAMLIVISIYIGWCMHYFSDKSYNFYF